MKSFLKVFLKSLSVVSLVLIKNTLGMDDSGEIDDRDTMNRAYQVDESYFDEKTEVFLKKPLGVINVSVVIEGDPPQHYTENIKQINDIRDYQLTNYQIFFQYPGFEEAHKKEIKDECLKIPRPGKSFKVKNYFETDYSYDAFFKMMDGVWQNYVSKTGVFYLIDQNIVREIRSGQYEDVLLGIYCQFPNLTEEQKCQVKKIRYSLRLHKDWRQSRYKVVILDGNDRELGMHIDFRHL